MCRNKKARSSNVTEKILNNDYTLSKYDFYPPEDNRTLKSGLVDKNNYQQYRKEYYRFMECIENDLDEDDEYFY